MTLALLHITEYVYSCCKLAKLSLQLLHITTMMVCHLAHKDNVDDCISVDLWYLLAVTLSYASRLIWLVIFLVASGLMVYLVAVKLIYLLSNPKNVNVDFNFNASLPFPAVTICNQSPYRYSYLWYCTFKPCPHCRRKVRLSHKSFSKWDSLTFVRQCHFSATVWTGH